MPAIPGHRQAVMPAQDPEARPRRFPDASIPGPNYARAAVAGSEIRRPRDGPPPKAATTLPDRDLDLIVASSRLPLTARRTAAGWTSAPGSGGLVAVLEPLLRKGS